MLKIDRKSQKILKSDEIVSHFNQNIQTLAEYIRKEMRIVP